MAHMRAPRSSARRSWLRQHRVDLATGLVAVVGLSSLIVYAVRSNGNPPHHAQLNDAGVWVSTDVRAGNNVAPRFGLISGKTFQYGASVPAQSPADDIRVLQDGSAVLGFDTVVPSVVQINPETGQYIGTALTLPKGAIPAIGGNDESGTAAILANGHVYATNFDATAVPDLSMLNPVGTGIAGSLGQHGTIAVGTDGTIYVATAAVLTSIKPGKAHTWTLRKQPLVPNIGGTLSVTAVGSTPVVLSSADRGGTATVQIPGSGAHTVSIPNASGTAYLQQPSDSNAVVYVEAQNGLYSVPLGRGQAKSETPMAVGPVPGPPVYVRGCVFAAWATQSTSVKINQNCKGTWTGADYHLAAVQINSVEFHVNHHYVLLNDPLSGAVFSVLGIPQAIDNWDAVGVKVNSVQPDPGNLGDQSKKPPVANDDVMGVRGGTSQHPATTRLPVLDNDGGASGVLSVASVEQPATPGVTATYAPDRQSILVTVASASVQDFVFHYTVSNGKTPSAKPALVTAHVVPNGTYAVPTLRISSDKLPDQIAWSVPVNASLSIPVLNDWRSYGIDKQTSFGTGDPVALDPLASGSVKLGHAISTSDGTIEYQAPNMPGTDTITYTTSDGSKQTAPQRLTITVIGASKPGMPPTANSDYVHGVVNVPFTFNPLLNDLPGADPANQNATLQLNAVQPTDPHLKVIRQGADGTLTLQGTVVGPYSLQYTDTYGTEVSKTAQIRIDIDPATAGAPIQTAPDSVTVHGSQPGLVDVLSNDFDPRGQLLTVVGVSVTGAQNLTAAVVQGRWIRVSETQPVTAPRVESLIYRVSDGLDNSVVSGQVMVNELPALDAPTPIVESDFATVRQGDEVSVPVLDNDSTQDGSQLTLEQDFRPTGTAALAHGQLPARFVGTTAGDPGQAFVAGNLVRFTAPIVPTIKSNQQVVVTYQVLANDGTAQTGSLFVTITPLGTRQTDHAPVPRDIQARVVAGGTTTIPIPTSGVDPDGDTVQVVGLAKNSDESVGPKLGQILATSANGMTYQAFPSATNGGTDTFAYTVVDTYGVTGIGTIKVSVVQPTVLPEPVPHAISVTAAPGTTILINVVSPAHIDYAEGDAPKLLDPAATNTGSANSISYAPNDPSSVRVVVPATPKAVINLGYQVQGDSGLTAASGITIHANTNYVAPPVAVDQFARLTGGSTQVPVPLLKGDFSQSGGTVRVISPASAVGGILPVTIKPSPQVIPYVIADSNGGQATAVVYVPAGGQAASPYWNGTAIHIPTPGSAYPVDITKYVKNPSGNPFHLTTKTEIWTAPAALLHPAVTSNTTLTLTSARDDSGNLYQGPASVTFPVTTSSNLNDVSYITIPVIIGNPTPVLRCPQDQIPVIQGFSSNPINIAAECHVWTADGDSSQLKFDIAVLHAVSGVSVDASGVHEPSVKASSNAVVGGSGSLTVSVAGVTGPTSQLGVVVQAAPEPSIASIPVQTVTSGAATVINLRPYFSSPFTIDAVKFVGTPKTSGTVAVATSGQWGISVNPKSQADLTSTVSFTISDNNQPSRDQTGTLLLRVLDVPSPPLNVIPRPEYDDHLVKIDWLASQPRGAGPVNYIVEYKLAGGGAWSSEIPAGESTSFNVPVPANGVPYVFMVKGCNGVKTPSANGCGPWSAASPAGTADMLPGPVTLLTAKNPPGAGSVATTGSLILTWVPPADHSSATGWQYLISWQGGSLAPITDRAATTATITGLPNDTQLLIKVTTQNEDNGHNGVPPAVASTPGESAGKPANPTWDAAQPFTATNTANGSSRVVTVHWNAVDPNGPPPTYYTVSRTDDKSSTIKVVCSLIHAVTSCDDPDQFSNNGTKYTYSIVASNQADQLPGRTGDFESGSVPSPQMQASFTPQGITNLVAQPTGQDGEAKLTFDLGGSNGPTSFVQCTVNGSTCAGSPWMSFPTAGQAGITELVAGLTNGSMSNFVLTACNNADTTTQHDAYSGLPCNQAPGASTVTYRQYVNPTVMASVSGNVVSWSGTGNADGRNVSVHVTDSQGAYNQTFTPEGPTSWSIPTQQFTLPPSTPDTITATVSDTGSSPTTRTVTSSQSNTVTTDPLTIPAGSLSCSGSGSATLNCGWGAAVDKDSVTYFYSWGGGSNISNGGSTNVGGLSLPADGNGHQFSVYARDNVTTAQSTPQTFAYSDPQPAPTSWSVTTTAATCPQDQFTTTRFHPGTPPTCTAPGGFIPNNTGLTVVCFVNKPGWYDLSRSRTDDTWYRISGSTWDGQYVIDPDVTGNLTGIPGC